MLREWDIDRCDVCEMRNIKMRCTGNFSGIAMYCK
jgi:hypothetical protein